jgi:exosortase/archaeosortase family protein
MVRIVLSRLQLLPLLFAISILNPFTYYILNVSRTYFWVAPLTVFIWFAFKWEDLSGEPTPARPEPWEILLGVALVAGTIGRGILQDPSARIFGFFDMLTIFVALVIILFGLRSLRVFWVPAAFLGIMGVGYTLERAVVDSLGYAEILSGLVAYLVRLLGGTATSNGPMIVLPDHGPSLLMVDYGCTGIKGILAFAFISFIPIIESARTLAGKVLWLSISLSGFILASIFRLVAVVFAVMAWGQVAVDYHTTIGFGFFMAWLVTITYLGTSPPSRPSGL